MAKFKTIRKTIAIVMLLCMMFSSVSFAAPGDPQQVKYLYFQDAGAGMVVVDFMQAINAAINGDPVLYNAMKAHLGTAVGNGSPIVIETTIGTVLDYQKALTQNKPSLVLFQDDATFQTAKPTYTSELTVVNGVASIVPLSIPVAPAVSNDDIANTVTGMVAGLEYSLDGAAYVAYDAVVFDALDFSGSHTLLVRVAAVGIVPAGAVTTLTFTVNPVTPPAPAVTNDDVNDTVTGMALGMEYSLDGGAYVAYDAAVFAALNFGGSHTLLVRIAAEGVNPPSADTVLIFTASGNEAAAAAVAAYEAAPISTLAEIAVAEGLKSPADAAVATVVNADQRLAFENRIIARAAQIAAAKSVLLGADAAAQAAAETAVAALEAAPLTNIAQINTATGLKYTAEARISLVGDVTAKAAFTQRVLVKTTAMAVAEITLQGYYGSIETALYKYNDILGLDFTDYNALANKQPVQMAMVPPVFTTVAEINTTFYAAVAAQKALEASPVAAFNAAADAAAIGAAITTHAATLTLGLTEYNTIANKTPVHTEMLGRGYTTGEDIRVAFAVAVMNNTTDARVKTLLTSNAKVLGLETTSEYTSLSTRYAIENAVIAAKPIADKLEIVVIAFNSTVNSGYIGQLLPINKGFLGLDMTVYDSLSNLNKLAVQSDLLAATLTSKADIQNAFNASVATRKASEDAGLAAFNNATDAAGIASAITAYIHPNDLGTYSALANKGAVHTTLLIQTFSSMVQVNAAFNAAVTDQKAVEDGVRTALNNVTVPAEMETFIQTNFLNLGLDLTNYNTLSAADKLPVLTVMIADTFYAMPVLKTTFDTAVAGQMAVAAVNSATAGTMGTVITTYAAALGLNTNDYILLSDQDKATVHGALEGKAFANKAAVVAAFEAAVAVPIINQITTTTAMATAINRYGTVLGLNMTDYGALFAPYNVTVQTALIGQNFADAAAVKAVFDAAVAVAKEAKAVAAINNAATNAAMNTAITGNAATLGLNLTEYNALTSKTPVQTALLAPVFTTAAEIRTAFNQAVAVQKVNEAVVAGMGSILVDKAVILGLDLTDYTALINKEPVHTALVSPVFANAAAVKTAFDAAVAAQKAIEDPGQNIPSVKLNKNATTLAVGGNETLIATVLPVTAPNKDVTWQSDNAGIATVNSAGNVTAVSAGTAVITVTAVDGGYTDTCTVTVVVPVTGVTLNKANLTMLLGSTETLIATVSPANATNKELIWTNETARATVDSTGKVTAVTAGVGSNITVKTVDGNFTATCYVRVVTEATAANAITQAVFTNNSMANTILEYASALSLDLTDYLALGSYEQGQVQMALLDPVFTSALQVQQVFYPAVAVQEINLAAADTMGAAIVKNASHLGLDLTAYNLLTNQDSVHIALADEIANMGPFASAAAFKTAFDAAVAAAGAPAAAPVPEAAPPALETGDPALQTAEAAVADFEGAPMTTLEEIAMVEGLMTAAKLAVAAVTDPEAKAALEQRINVRAETAAKAQAALEALAEAALQAAAELSVTAYESGSLLTLDDVAVAEALKAIAESDVAAVGNQEIIAALEQRITARAEAIAAARALLEQEEPADEPAPEAPVQEEAPPVKSDAPVEDAAPAEEIVPAE